MADRDGERVGGVVRPRQLEQPEQRLHHARHLLLVCAAAAAHRPLDLLRGVARARDGALARREHRGAARLTDGERRTHVLTEVQLLERKRIGLVLVDQHLDGRVDIGQAPLLRRLGAGADDAAVERDEAAVAARDDAVAGVGQPGIDAEDYHWTLILRLPPDACLAYAGAMPGPDIDYAAEGLLDGLDGDARAERLALLEQLSAEGVGLPDLRRSTDSGTVLFLPANRVIVGEARYTAAEVAELSGIEPEFLAAARRATGLPIPDDDEPLYTDAEVESAQRILIARQAGIADEEILDLLRVLGRGLSQAAETLRQVPLRLVLEPGISERDLAARYAQAAAALYPLVDPMVSNVLALHLRQTTQSEVVSAMERSGGQLAGAREVAVCFADLVGFTRLGEEVAPDELGRLAVRLEALAADVATPPVRLVKTIGDAAMLASIEPEPLLDAALALIDAADAEGEDFPQLKAGAALGLAVPRAGDWFGRPVNLASRITSVARPGSLLAEREVRESASDAYRWSFAGERRLRGIREPVALFRARRPAPADARI